MLSKFNVGLSLLSYKSHRLGKLRALVRKIKEGKGCHLNFEDCCGIDEYGGP